MKLSAFILAAGLGERLLPITRHIPKPLLPILGNPILKSVLQKIAAIPINNIAINLHHKQHLIEDWVRRSEYSEAITLFHEAPILGTGGALKNAEGFLKNGPFLVHNADILSDIDLSRLIDTHVSSGNIATLAVHNHPEFNSLMLNKNGTLKEVIGHPHPSPPPSMGREVKEHTPPIRDIEYPDRSLSATEINNTNSSPARGGGGLGGGGKESIASLAFTGIAVYRPDFLQFLPDGNSSVVDAWFRAMSAGHSIGTMDVTGCYWTDVGTPASFARAVIHAMRQDGENIYIHESVKGCSNASFEGYIVVEEENIIKQDASLKNCISLPGTIISETPRDNTPAECLLTLFWGAPDLTATKKSRNFENCILGPDFSIQLSESDFGVSEDNTHYFIGTGGSDRKYFRVRNDEHSSVLMKCAQSDPDFHRHIAYTTFFRRYDVPVPELLNTDNEAKTALFEDLGDISLYSWLKCFRTAEHIEKIYRQVLDILITIQTTASMHADECPLLQGRIFDYDHFRWETGYFLEWFVQGMKHISIEDLASLDSEFRKLAATANAFPKTIVHRDFQSQNIMITRDGIPRVVDYQGARIGPPAYDVVSLLWDPYHRLEDGVREKLLTYYIQHVIPPPLPLKKGGNISVFAKKVRAKKELCSFSQGGFSGITEDKFRKTILPCRLQRHMQALGAYGFLTTVKGKTYFQKHVPEGIRLLKGDVSETGDDYPALYRLVMEL